MRNSSLLVALAALTLAGCGSGEGTTTPSSTSKPTGAGGFNPPPAPAGYTRLTAQTVHGVKPGDDVTYCQYAMPAFDHDVDVLDVGGYQSAFGHHAVIFSYKDDGTQTIGTSMPCMGTEFSSGTAPASGSTAKNPSLNLGAFLGGAAGAGGSGSALPAGVAFRLPKGNGIMLNVHFLNTGSQTIDGDSVIDVKFGDPDPSRRIAAMFLNLNFGFDLPPNTHTDSSVECVAGDDVPILMMGNHMHEFGSSVSTVVQHAGSGAIESLHEDPTWTYDMQFNVAYSRWTPDAPYVLHAGDTFRTSCSWENSTPNEMKFPREMCIGVGFALVSADNPHAPACVNGTWMSKFL